VWFINTDCEPQLMGMGAVVGLGGQLLWMRLVDSQGCRIRHSWGSQLFRQSTMTPWEARDIVLADMGSYLFADKGGCNRLRAFTSHS